MTVSLIWLVSASRKRTDILQSFTINAVVLRETQYKDNDIIITLLTAEKGIISALARGILNMSSKNRPAIQLFCYSEFEITKHGNRYIVKSANLKELFYNVRCDIEKYAFACYAADAACSLCTEENDETDAFRLVLNTFAALNNVTESAKPVWQIKAAFELKLCAVCGFMPELNMCAECGSVKEDAESVREKFIFSLTESSLYCEDCAKGLSDRSMNFSKLSYPVLCAMRYISTSPISRFLSFRIADESAPELSDICEKYLLNLAERRFDTLKYYKSLIN